MSLTLSSWHHFNPQPSADVLRLLVCERLLEPGSKLAAWENKDRHFFRTQFSEDDVYRSLSELDRLSGRLVDACNRAIAKHTPRDESLIYYDVTNYFFECDPDVEGLRKKGEQRAQAQPHFADGDAAG